jgi:nicotinate-nucleotide pyrophosphorylase
MSELKIMKGNRVDHPRKKSKDLADALCGAVFGAISHTPKTNNTEIEVHTWSSATRLADKQARMVELDNREMPSDVKNFLDNLNLI